MGEGERGVFQGVQAHRQAGWRVRGGREDESTFVVWASSAEDRRGTDPDGGGGDGPLISVRAAGVCRTDLDYVDGSFTVEPVPMIPGHEVAGDVEQIYPGNPDDVNAGGSGGAVQRNCGLGRSCPRGQENLCTNRIGQLGMTANGGLPSTCKSRCAIWCDCRATSAARKGRCLAVAA